MIQNAKISIKYEQRSIVSIILPLNWLIPLLKYNWLSKCVLFYVYILMILDKRVHTWQHLYDQSFKHSHHLQKCPYVLCVFLCVCVVKRLNKGPMLLTYLNVNNTVLLVISIMFYSRSLKCTHFAYLKLNACWSVTPHFSFLPGPGHYKCILCFCVLDLFYIPYKSGFM